MKYVGTILLTIVITCSLQARAACIAENCNSKDFWATHAVIIAQVATSSAKNGLSTMNVQLLAVAETDFLVPATLTIDRFWIGGDSAISPTNLHPGSVQILCISRTADGKGWTITNNGVSFMRNGSAVVTVSDLHDQEIANTCERFAACRKQAGL